jgi:hypothetical protein
VNKALRSGEDAQTWRSVWPTSQITTATIWLICAALVTGVGIGSIFSFRQGR